MSKGSLFHRSVIQWKKLYFRTLVLAQACNQGGATGALAPPPPPRALEARSLCQYTPQTKIKVKKYSLYSDCLRTVWSLGLYIRPDCDILGWFQRYILPQLNRLKCQIIFWNNKIQNKGRLGTCWLQNSTFSIRWKGNLLTDFGIDRF